MKKNKLDAGGKKVTRFLLGILTVIIFISGFNFTAAAAAAVGDITILFTHDLHSHLLPAKDEDGGEYGGYARLMTAINEQKAENPNAILVDGGDFSMGSLFQTAFTTSATELRMMGAMGYDVTTFGNHEFDYLQDGLASMLNVAAACGEKVPEIVCANYLPHQKGEDGYNAKINEAFENYGVKEYTIIERGGVYFAVFGIFGIESDDYAPNSNMVMKNQAETAQKIVDEATAYCKKNYGTEPVTVCLSHSGTEGGKGEDYELAKNVKGIDVIISGHSHTTLTKPITVNGTYIVSAGEYGKNLGVLQLDISQSGEVALSEYQVIPIDENVSDDSEISAKVENFKKTVENDYLSKYGVSFDEVLALNPYKFDTVDEVYETLHESTLGNLFSDAYKWAVEDATGEKVDVALTASGVIRDTLPVGNVTVSDIFNAASLGVGTEGELVAVYITGKDLKNALEVDASVQPLMDAAQLFCSGIKYSANTNRMIFNKVDYARLQTADGTLNKIENDKLYRIVTGMYCGQMLGTVKETSFGLLSITPLDKDGNPIAADELVNYVVKDKNGNPLKEWYAISSYIKTMDGTIDEKYSKPDGRKVIYQSINPVKLLRNANIFTFVLLAIIILLIVAIVFIVRAIVRKVKQKKEEKNSETNVKGDVGDDINVVLSSGEAELQNEENT